MNSLQKMLGVLDLFEGGRLEWSIDELLTELGYPRSTLYRYLKTLVHAGLLTPHGEANFTLGPRIVELDYEIRKSDPFIRHGQPRMAALVKRVDGVALLCRIYRDRVLCVHQESRSANFVSGYVRGLAMPLVRGAASRVILACLPTSRLSRIYEENRSEFTRLNLGKTFSEAMVYLRKIRREGYCIASGEIASGRCGIAAPLFDQNRKVIGSISISVGEKNLSQADAHRIATKVKAVAAELTAKSKIREK